MKVLFVMSEARGAVASEPEHRGLVSSGWMENNGVMYNANVEERI